MHSYLTNSLFTLLLSLPACLSIPQYPIPISQQCIEGDGQINYVINSQNVVSGKPVTGDYTVKGGEGLSASSTFSTGTTITKGVDVGISKIVSAGLSYSVATTTTNSKTQGGNVDCPEGPWYCALQIYPEMLHVTGRMEQKNQGLYPCTKVPQDFDVLLPIYGDSGNVRSRLEVCSCGNFEHWADNGAPSLHCPDCAGPK